MVENWLSGDAAESAIVRLAVQEFLKGVQDKNAGISVEFVLLGLSVTRDAIEKGLVQLQHSGVKVLSLCSHHLLGFARRRRALF